MSSVLNFIVEVSDHYRETLIEALEKQAKKHNIGVWHPGSAHFYMEQYIPYIAPPKSLIFDLADNTTYNNCEDLVTPWWFIDCGEELYEKHMRIIESFCSLCLEYASVVHLVIGTSGMTMEDLDTVPMTISDFFQDIKQRYDSDIHPPPFVHYVFIHQLQIKTCILELNEHA